MNRLRWLAAGVIAAAVLTAYSNCYSGVFAMDDWLAIVANPTIRHLGDLQRILTPLRIGGITVAGRPMLNLSFAVNYAISGTDVWSYHLLNVLIHLGAALVLFGILRRIPGTSIALAFVAALLWAVHPLNTESVTYVVQRAESLMGLLYLLTIYSFVRIAENEGGAGAAAWTGLSVAFCLLGMATKEVMISAPLTVLILDRRYFAGSFSEAWRRRKAYYALLAATSLLLGALVLRTGNRGGTVGFGSGVSVWRYWASQPAAIAHYLKLAVWPSSLVFDYGTSWATRPAQVVGPALLLLVLAAATIRGLARNRTAGLLGFCFFATLAPTSLVPGNLQTAAEHRMYLALIPVIIVVLGSLARALSQKSETRAEEASTRRLAGPVLAALGLVLALPAGLATHARNSDYSSALRLYGDTVAKRPDNPYARANYATALAIAHRYVEAEDYFEAALRLKPDYPIAEGDLGNVCFALGQYGDAESHYRRAIQLDPEAPGPHDSLAATYLKESRVADARREVEMALRIWPGMPSGHDHLGMVLLDEGRLPEALGELAQAVRLEPREAAAHADLGMALRMAGRRSEAIPELQRALQLDASLEGPRRALRELGVAEH